jgi:predicted DNA-binding protein YlxM (UPF0122 family)
MGIKTRQSRFDVANLTERQLKAFDAMYTNLEYSVRDIADRFGMSTFLVTQLAHDRGLPPRKHRG